MYLYLFEIDKYIHLQLLLYLSKICICICLKLYNCFIARRPDSQIWLNFRENSIIAYVALFREIQKFCNNFFGFGN